MPEILSSEERARAIADLSELRKQYPKLDMPEAVIRQFRPRCHRGPKTVFLRSRLRRCRLTGRTRILHASLAGIRIAHRADASQSMGLASIASHKLGGLLSVGTIFKASIKIGQHRAKFRAKHQVPEALQILQEKRKVRQPGPRRD